MMDERSGTDPGVRSFCFGTISANVWNLEMKTLVNGHLATVKDTMAELTISWNMYIDDSKLAASSWFQQLGTKESEAFGDSGAALLEFSQDLCAAEIEYELQNGVSSAPDWYIRIYTDLSQPARSLTAAFKPFGSVRPRPAVHTVYRKLERMSRSVHELYLETRLLSPPRELNRGAELSDKRLLNVPDLQTFQETEHPVDLAWKTGRQAFPLGCYQSSSYTSVHVLYMSTDPSAKSGKVCRLSNLTLHDLVMERQWKASVQTLARLSVAARVATLYVQGHEMMLEISAVPRLQTLIQILPASGDVEDGNIPHNHVELPLSWHCPWDQRPGDDDGSPLQSQHRIAQEFGVIYSILTGMDFFKGHRETVSGLEAVRNRLLGGLRDSMTERCLGIDDRLKRLLSGALTVTKLDSRADELAVKEDICSGLRISLREWNTSYAMVNAESFLDMPEPAAVHTPRWTTGARGLAP